MNPKLAQNPSSVPQKLNDTRILNCAKIVSVKSWTCIFQMSHRKPHNPESLAQKPQA